VSIAYLSLEDLLGLADDLDCLAIGDKGLLDSAAHRPGASAFGGDPQLCPAVGPLLRPLVRTEFAEFGSAAHQLFEPCRSRIRNFVETPDRPCWLQYGVEPLISGGRSGEPMSINPFDDANGSFFVLVKDEGNTACGRRSPMFRPVGGWSTARSGTRCVSGLHRAELDRHTAEESARSLAEGRASDT
jgi:hypothetical protein